MIFHYLYSIKINKMKPRYFLFTILICFSVASCSTLGKMALKPSTWETIAAIKDILNSSVFKALAGLTKLHSDNPEASLPAEIKPVLATLKTLGYGDEVSKVTKAVGNASGIALNESKGIMADAIKEVNLGDAVSIVLGGEDAATQVLKKAMKGAIKKRYSAALEAQLGKTDALKYWPMAATAYNLFAKNKVDGNLSDFMAERAVDAIFLTMGSHEKEIRRDPASVGSAVVTKVFDYYNKRGKA